MGLDNKHDHVAGRPRDYISRKWFHRARHRPTSSSFTVAELVETIGMEVDPRSGRWPTTKNGKFYIWNGPIQIPEMPYDYKPRGFITAPEGISQIPMLISYDPLTPQRRDAMLDQWATVLGAAVVHRDAKREWLTDGA